MKWVKEGLIKNNGERERNNFADALFNEEEKRKAKLNDKEISEFPMKFNTHTNTHSPIE
jgi:hypothetical protein